MGNMTFSSVTETWFDWVWAGGYVPHGPVHYYIGGYTNCGNLLEEFEKLGLGQEQVNDYAVWMVQLPKNFWKAYVTEAPESCSHDTPQTECHMKCMLDYENKQHVKEFFTMMYGWIGELGKSRVNSDASWLVNLNETQSAGLMKLYCETPFSPGEQIESASPIDVSFWPIHPTMERLMQYKRMANDFTSLVWENPNDDDNDMNNTDSLFKGYCFQGENEHYAKKYMGKSETDVLGTECLGHHADDMTMFKSSIKDASTGKYVYRATTNIELFRMINPAEYMASYIYEDFEYTHCTGAYAFPAVAGGNSSDTNADFVGVESDDAPSR